MKRSITKVVFVACIVCCSYSADANATCSYPNGVTAEVVLTVSHAAGSDKYKMAITSGVIAHMNEN